MSFLGGMLASGCAEVRQLLNEPANSTKLIDAIVLSKMADNFSAFLREMQSITERPLTLTMSYTLSSSTESTVTDKFQLPSTCTVVRRVWAEDASGNTVHDLGRRREYDSLSPNCGYSLRGTWIEIVRPSGDGATRLKIEYEPGGYLPLHYGTLPASARDTSEGLFVVPSAATNVVGVQDDRPNAYVGGMLRVLNSADIPTGYTYKNNVIERYFTTWNMQQHRAGLDSALDYTDGGDWTYEILPTIDWGIWRAVILWTARFVANGWGRRDQAAGLQNELITHARSLRLSEAHADAAAPPEYFTDVPRRSRRGLGFRTGLR